MTVHAFVDESERCHSYLLGVAIVEPHRLTQLRGRMMQLLMPGQREIHFHKEKLQRRRLLADRIGQLPVAVRIYRAEHTPRTAEQARQRCLARAVHDLLQINAHRLVMDTRDARNAHDKHTIQRILAQQPSHMHLTYEHTNSTLEPLCWIADAAAWCHGRQGEWRDRIRKIIDEVIDLDKRKARETAVRLRHGLTSQPHSGASRDQ